MDAQSSDPIRNAIRDIPDFPRPGIIFKDITPILMDSSLFRLAIQHFVNECAIRNVHKIAGIDARGFIFGATVAHELKIGFVPVRKKGKLPGEILSQAYQLEYGEAELEIQTDAFQAGDRVVVIDDLLATGGTAQAAISLIQSTGAKVVQVQFVIELAFLKGREVLAPTPTYSIVPIE